ncbi:MAG: B12-binding domain-containing radical SAM protein [bacterium]|nr:B12-binding domain-containing radical SAM protein [bacterium]
MTILLINPPAAAAHVREGRCTQATRLWGTAWPPLTLAYCAAVLHDAGHVPCLLDGAVQRLPDAVLRRAAAAAQVAVVAVGNDTGACDCAFAAMLKTINPALTVVLIGTYAAACATQIFAAHPGIDAIVAGEPEYSVRDCVAACAACVPLPGIPGVMTRAASLVARPFIEPLDALPFPRWECIDPRRYRLPLLRRRLLLVAPMRGCPYSCTFCTTQQYYGTRVRTRSVASVVAELERNVRDFGVRDFLLWAETLTGNRPFVMALCEELQRRALRVRWSAASRVDTVDAEMLRAMRGAGCRMLSFGIESLSQEVLDQCGKRVNVEEVAPAIHMARRAGLWTVGHFIVGLPGDTPERARATVAGATRLPLDFAQFYAAAAFAGSRLQQALDPADRAGASQADFQHLPAALQDIARGAAYHFYGTPRRLLYWSQHLWH